MAPSVRPGMTNDEACLPAPWVVASRCEHTESQFQLIVPSRSLPYVEAACSVTSTIQSIWVLHILSRLQAADALKPQAQASKLADPPSPRLIHTLTGEREETTPRFETSPHTRYTQWHPGTPLTQARSLLGFRGRRVGSQESTQARGRKPFLAFARLG